MIIIKLQGGLGNQMFQYACAKSLALRLNQELLLDTFFFADNQKEQVDYTPRSYELDLFKIEAPAAKRKQVKAFTNPSKYQKVRRKLKLPFKKIIHEDIEQGISQLKNIKSDVYLDGYWQSEDYFRLHAPIIRSQYAFPEFDKNNATITERISATDNSVSLHIRRGDYLNPKTQLVHGSLPLSYYYNALDIIKERHGALTLFVFSDDITWAKSNLVLPGFDTFFIDHNKASEGWKDMALMSKCKHHILANSSFSWWAAWLNPNPDEMVIAPLRWFADEDLNTTSVSLIPDSWIRI